MIMRPPEGWNVTCATPPGEMLLEEFMKPMGLSSNRLASELKIPVSRVHDILHARRGITADTACRLSLFFGTSAEFWLNLQQSFNLVAARRKLKTIRKEIKPFTRLAS